jgi:hypothetical protein
MEELEQRHANEKQQLELRIKQLRKSNDNVIYVDL